MSTKVANIATLVEKISDATESIQEYSYRYNVKIVGVPQQTDSKTSETAANLCWKLFHSMGATQISLLDIDTAHQVASMLQDDRTRPNAIVCKFAHRSAKGQVMAASRERRKINVEDLGLPSDVQVDQVAIFNHSTPRMQHIFYQAKRFK